MPTKYLFITGGVCSSLGKGLSAAAIGLLLERLGLKIALLKFDPYLNVDPGTMNPFQHGEIYVTGDGAETDLDLGHYHRFTNSPLTKASNATSGQIFETVIQSERHGKYLGNTVQIVPHITNEIKRRIIHCSRQEPKIDVVIVEIGGTVGDIESLPFLEALRQFTNEHPEDCVSIHLTYVPYLSAAGEYKTKPSQHSVQELRSTGLFPKIIVCRCENPLPPGVKRKISLFCNVACEAVIEAVDVHTSIYELPLRLEEQGVSALLCKSLGLANGGVDLSDWKRIVHIVEKPKGMITVGIVGKYVQHQDAYKSVYEALAHGALAHEYGAIIKEFEPSELHTLKDMAAAAQTCDGFLVPGGFGDRGFEGKILAAQYCREHKVPFLGICLGMQAMAVEFARHVMGWEDAASTEINPHTSHPVVLLLSEQQDIVELGGTMRLGDFPCTIKEGTRAYQAYQKEQISERHRHRYEFNSRFLGPMQESGLIVSGILVEQNLAEIAELVDHPWMLGVQFHPEYKSRPTDPHPLFRAFANAMIKQETFSELGE